MRRFQLLSLIMLIIVLVIFGSRAWPQDRENVSDSLTVSVATSLADVMDEIAAQYEEDHGVSITLNIGSSGSLQRQILQGAPVDVLVPASSRHMDQLQEKGLILEETRKDLLQNQLVLVTPHNLNKIVDFHSLADAGVVRIGIGDPETSPAGSYAKEVFLSLGLCEEVERKLIYGKNVRQVLNWVQTGNVDAGIVYLSDARATDNVKVIALAPDGAHSPIVYPAAVMQNSSAMEAARDFTRYLAGEKAGRIFTEHGFDFVAD